MKKIWMMAVLAVGMMACTQQNTPTDPTSGDTEGTVTPTDTVGDDVANETWTDTLKIVWNGANATVKGSVDSVSVVSNNGYVTVTSTSPRLITYILSGSGTGNISFYGETKFNLSLDGLTLACSNAPAVNNQCKKTCFVVVNGTNSLSDGSSYASSSEDRKAALFSEGQLIFSGEGSLSVTGNYKHGVASDDYIHFRSGTLSVKAASDGLRANDGVFIDGGTLSIQASADGIQCDTNVVSIKGGTTSVIAGDEGITSYGAITVSGGVTYVQAVDDCINSSMDITVSGGYLCAYSTGNDGIDANGNCYIKGGVVYAIGASSPEVAIDANSEEQKKLYVQGGTIVALGGIESGASLTQTCYQASSWSRNTWYALTVGSEVFAFKTPSSSGSQMVISAASTPTLLSGVTVNGGTSIFNGMAQSGASVSGGSSVTLSGYTSSGNGGGNPGGGPGGGRPN